MEFMLDNLNTQYYVTGQFELMSTLNKFTEAKF